MTSPLPEISWTDRAGGTGVKWVKQCENVLLWTPEGGDSYNVTIFSTEKAALLAVIAMRNPVGAVGVVTAAEFTSREHAEHWIRLYFRALEDLAALEDRERAANPRDERI